MKDKYTKNARAALNAAKNASKKANQNYIGTEHLIMGLVQEPDGVASSILAENGVTAERLEEMISQLNIHPGSLALLDHEGDSGSFGRKHFQYVLRAAGSHGRKSPRPPG